MTKILQKLALVPSSAGVYVMRDEDSHVIYIGKAKNLPKRLANYFVNKTHDAKTTAMLSRVRDFEYFICKTENDALGLEANLIKRHKPHYNILLKDNKTFPYIRVTENKIEITRQLGKRGKYFGPYFNGIWAHGLLDTIYDIFDVRDTADKETIEKIKLFLRGERDFNAREILTEKMNQASELQQFELAIRYRNGLGFLDKLKERTITNVARDVNCDVFGAVSSADIFVVSVLTVRAGKLIGVQNFSNIDNSPLADTEKLDQFIGQYYLENLRPDEIVTDAKIGYKKNLVDMANANAREYLGTSIEKIKHKNQFTLGACMELGNTLSIPTPKRIECYDISHMGGEYVVASMVVFVDGVEDKKSYRKFKIKTDTRNDDYQSMREVITRRIKRLDDQSFGSAPDIIVLDGGLGQLNMVKDIVPNITLCAFGGERDDLITTDGQVISFDKHSYAFRLLQRLRDEAHRFCNEYRKSLTKKNMR